MMKVRKGREEDAASVTCEKTSSRGAGERTKFHSLNVRLTTVGGGVDLRAWHVLAVPLMTDADVATYCIAVHIGAGYHSERHASEYKRLIADACQAAVSVLKKVGHSRAFIDVPAFPIHTC